MLRPLGFIFSMLPLALSAEPIIDINPHVQFSKTFEDNLFRFASDAEARAAGFTTKSDSVERLQGGVDVNLRLSRQLFKIQTNLVQNTYQKNDFLNNNEKNLKLIWQWRIGSKLYGEMSARQNQSIANFTDNDIIVNNLRTFRRYHLDVNWKLSSAWTLYGLKEFGVFDNDKIQFSSLNSRDEVDELGVRYQTDSGSQIGWFYRNTDYDYPDRSGNALLFFGSASRQRQYGINLTWTPSAMTQLTGQVSKVDLKRDGAPERNFNGLSQRWNLAHGVSAKTTLGFTVYRDVMPLDDFLATYVESTGWNANLTWNMTTKTSFSGGMGRYSRDFLGGISNLTAPIQRQDHNERFTLSLNYLPFDNATLQMYLNADQRDANIPQLSYEANSLGIMANYYFK